jgi:hypothetical protein
MSNDNKRITELVSITPAAIANGDLFALADVSVPETKKLAISDLATWVGASASISINSASYSKTASFLIFPPGSRVNGTASFSISSSWAGLAYSASFVVSSSRATTASYSRTCSYLDGTLSGSITADNAKTASYLKYQGWFNGSSSYALTSSRTISSDTASYIYYPYLPIGSSFNNGTIYRSITASLALTASSISGAIQNLQVTASWATRSISSSFLIYSPAISNGTASHAKTAETAVLIATASSVNNAYIFREWGPLTSSILAGGTTASFGNIKVTGSVYSPKLYVEAWGDIKIPMSSSVNYSCSLLLNLSESVSSNYDLDIAKFQCYITGSDPLYPTIPTGSIIRRWTMKGHCTAAGNHVYKVGVYADNGMKFETGSNDWSGVRCIVKANTDNVIIYQ